MNLFNFDSALNSLALYSLPENRVHHCLTTSLTIERKLTLFNLITQVYGLEQTCNVNKVAKAYINAINELAGHLQMQKSKTLKLAQKGLEVLRDECDDLRVIEELSILIDTFVVVRKILKSDFQREV
jgi:hypothetical protein